MKKVTLLFGLLLATIMMVAQPTVSIENLKMRITDGEKSYVLAPNGDDTSYFWASVSPDGKHIVYVTSKYGTFVCDIDGQNVRSLGRMNAPKWLDNNHVSGMQEFYKGHDEIDHIRYISRNINDKVTRDLTDSERVNFINAEEKRLASERQRQAKRLAAKRTDAQKADFSGIRIYLNPGHGGYDLNDRSCWTIPVPEMWKNPEGYWESKSNLVKGLFLYDMLKNAGATVQISRTTNKSGIRDVDYYPEATAQELKELENGDDRDLSAIAEEANAFNADHFLSIHTNAINTKTNYLLMLYHGQTDNPKVPQSDLMAKSSGNIQIKNDLTVWTASAVKIFGDWDFYGDEYGLGVLRPLTVPGFLSEGSFHDYAPETHRLMNDDYCKLEALRLFEHFHRWFNVKMPQTGTISGWVKSGNELVDVLNEPNFFYPKNTDDQWLPLNGAKVELYKGETLVGTYTTDNWYNGIFAFYDLQPGTYKLVVTKNKYKTITQEVTVEAEKIAQVKVKTNNLRLTLDDYPQAAADILAVDNYSFELVSKKTTVPSKLERAIYRNGKYYILANGELAQYNTDLTNKTVISLPAGVAISDFGFSADGYLVAKVKDQGKFYTWDEDMKNPTVLFTVSNVKGNTFAITGARWESKYYLAEGKTIYEIAYNEDENTAKVTTKTSKEDLTGKQLTITPLKELASVNGASFFNYDHAYMVKPDKGLSFQLFDVNEGLDKAKAVSKVYPEDNTTTQANTHTMAWVDGYVIHVVIMAEGYGMQHFKTNSTPVANIYASEVKYENNILSFRLNQDATDVTIALEEDGQEVASKNLGALKKGPHSIENPFPEMSHDYVTITASALPVAFPVKISNDDEIFQFYAGRGVAVDRTPSSPFFGRVYVTNSEGGKCGVDAGVAPASKYRNSSMGVYILSSDLKDITKQGAKGYTGDIDWGVFKFDVDAGIYEFPLSRPTVAPDGDVFIASTALKSSGVYIMNPADPKETFVTVFEGVKRNLENGQILASATKAVANPVMHCCVLGTGKDEVLYTYDRDASKGNVLTDIKKYNIGELETLPWTKAPTSTFYSDKKWDNFMQNGCGQIAYDQRGGFFMSQYRANSSYAKPALLHVASNGRPDFNISNKGVDAALQGGMALNVDGSVIALATEAGYVKLWDVTYDEDGTPELTEKYEIKWADGGRVMAMDFDAAGNLYIVSNTYERLLVYSLPKAENKYTTRVPSNRSTGVENNLVDQPVLRKGIYTILGQYLGEDESALPHGMYIINGKKVTK